MSETAASGYESITRLVVAFLTERARHIEDACVVALVRGCGVRVTNTPEGGYTVTVDPSVPPLNIHEYLSTGAVTLHEWPQHYQLEKIIHDTPSKTK